MGSSSSGNWRGRPTIDSGIGLAIGKLVRDGIIVPGRRAAGSLCWSNTTTGESLATISFESNVDHQCGSLRLMYESKIWSTGEKRGSDYQVSVVSTVQPFGGRRWWFLCPRSGMRVSKLYMPNGALSFASRQAFRLGYRSQRATPEDRALTRAFRLRKLLGNDGGIGEVILKPKGMHQTTFDRRLNTIGRSETICNAHLLGFLSHLQGKRRM